MTVATLSPVTAADFDFYEADYARMCLMTDLRDEMVAFFASDDELEAMIAETYGYDAWNHCEGKFEINDYYANEARFSMLYRVQTGRADRRAREAALTRYTNVPALTHSPFAALLVR